MSEEAPPAPPPVMPGPSPEDLAQLFAAGMPSPEPPPSRGSMRRKLIIAILIAGIGVGASAMSCVGQSFSLRQARALEGIEQQLSLIRTGCVASPPPREVAR